MSKTVVRDIDREFFQRLNASLEDVSENPEDSLETLESLLCSERGFGLTTASPLQRALCRIMGGEPLGDLANDPVVLEAVGPVSEIDGCKPKMLVVLSGTRTGKSLLSGAIAVHAALTCDVSRLGLGEDPRVSILSIDKDKAKVVYKHILGNMLAKPGLRGVLYKDPTADTIFIRHPTGRCVEIKIVAGSKEGAAAISRWTAGIILDEATRMNGEEDGMVNFDETVRAVYSRLLPGAPIVAIGSPWAPRGPVYELVNEHWGKPTPSLVVVRCTADKLNPVLWTPEYIEEFKKAQPEAYRTDVLAEFADPESGLFTQEVLEQASRVEPDMLPPRKGYTYVAAMDPATRGNGWTLVIVTKDWRTEVTKDLFNVIQTRMVSKRVVVYAREWRGSASSPLDPAQVLAEMKQVLAPYHVEYVETDQWSSDALKSLARMIGMNLVEKIIPQKGKVELYENLRLRVLNNEVELSPEPQVRSDLLSVRKHTTRTGIVMLEPHTSDGRHADFAPSVARALGMFCAEPRLLAQEGTEQQIEADALARDLRTYGPKKPGQAYWQTEARERERTRLPGPRVPQALPGRAPLVRRTRRTYWQSRG